MVPISGDRGSADIYEALSVYVRTQSPQSFYASRVLCRINLAANEFAPVLNAATAVFPNPMQGS